MPGVVQAEGIHKLQDTLFLPLFLFNRRLSREQRHYITKAISHWLPIPQGEGSLSSCLVLLSIICNTGACPVTLVSRAYASDVIRLWQVDTMILLRVSCSELMFSLYMDLDSASLQ